MLKFAVVIVGVLTLGTLLVFFALFSGGLSGNDSELDLEEITMLHSCGNNASTACTKDLRYMYNPNTGERWSGPGNCNECGVDARVLAEYGWVAGQPG